LTAEVSFRIISPRISRKTFNLLCGDRIHGRARLDAAKAALAAQLGVEALRIFVIGI